MPLKDFKTVIKTLCCRQKNRWINKSNRIEGPEIANWSLTKEQRQFNGTKTIFSINRGGTTKQSETENESRHRPYPLPKN